MLVSCYAKAQDKEKIEAFCAAEELAAKQRGEGNTSSRPAWETTEVMSILSSSGYTGER